MTTPRLLNRLTFRQLQVFQAVYRQHSYSRAAETLGLTQPAVSAQIRQLEQVLGQPLFKYSGKTLHVLPAADALSASTLAIFGQVSRLQMALSDMAGTISGELNLAAVSTAQYVVPHLIARFRAHYPNVQVRLQVCNRSQALERLAERRDDLVIMAMVPEDDDNLIFMPILENELIPVVWPGHPLLAAANPTLEDLAQHYLLMRESGSGVRTAFEQQAAEQDVPLPHTMELGTNEAIKQGVMAHLGVAVLPRLAVKLELGAGLLAELTLPGFPLRRSWCTVYPRDRFPTPVTELFLRFVRERLGEFDAHFKAPPKPIPDHGVVCLPIQPT
ncbi:LysR family transcriptional regulator [Halomonas sp. M5N1S17]|uniref:LysR family transcriptional regulator n=1 Tax=Halomonas alkalisoli TaxID=2907158 RepID=UPI001F2B9B9C|nr:LysR family transcriptional regulator [Halomonas alkalisoli]MCE9665108.1 LysR family transcriptional regulator [Halomonas alkalisoli]MCE9683185.1 LysR family transcriptional regulator [Halomonas alkalisoli]